jgi:hypothetical protein
MLFYQNDDFGKDFVNGLRDVLSDRYSSIVQDRRFAAGHPSHALPAIGDNCDEDTVAMRHAQLVSAKLTCCCNNRYVRADLDLVCIDGGDAG